MSYAASVGAIAAMATAVMTVITFGLAMTAVPIAGPYCPYESECISYPFTKHIKDQFPKDYLWMFAAIPQTMTYLVLVASIQAWAPNRVFGTIALVFATIATSLLVGDYWVQLTVIQPSVLKEEFGSGLELVTMYNGHGVFIALEEAGFFCMSVSFLALAPLFSGPLRWLLVTSFMLSLLALLYTTAVYGWERSYRFEVAVIAIDWTTLIVGSSMMARVFWREGVKDKAQ